MKTILILFLFLLSNSTIFSQETITYYASRAEFKEACTGNLLLEDFAGGPSDTTRNTSCTGDISAEGNSCFPAHEIQPGIVITSSNTDIPGENYMIFTPAAFGPDSVDAVAVNQLESFPIIKFPNGDVNSVGLNFSFVFGNSFVFRVFGATGIIDTLELNVPVGDEVEGLFYGCIANEPITRIEFQGADNTVELLGKIEFGTCGNTSATDSFQDYKFQFYPNPVNNNLILNANKKIALVKIYNLLGQEIDYKTPATKETQIDMSNFNKGTYFIKVQINDETSTFKVIKN